MNKKVLLVIASRDFQIIEYETPKAILEKAGIGVVTVSDGESPNGAPLGAVASNGKKVKIDLVIGDPSLTLPYEGRENFLSEYGGLFIVGGEGALEHLDNEASYQLLKKWSDFAKATPGRPYGAICISTRILAHAGVLQGKKATGWNGDDKLPDILSSVGAEFVDQPVVVDGNVVTGNGPEAAGEWGEAITKILGY